MPTEEIPFRYSHRSGRTGLVSGVLTGSSNVLWVKIAVCLRACKILFDYTGEVGRRQKIGFNMVPLDVLRHFWRV